MYTILHINSCTCFFSIPCQAVRDGCEEVLRQWLCKEETDGGGEKEIENENEGLKNINACDPFGFTAMHYAARFNRFEEMKLLIANNAGKMEEEREGVMYLLCVPGKALRDTLSGRGCQKIESAQKIHASRG